MAERPVECTQCKKAVKTVYKEIVGGAITCFEMCSDCPILEEKLHGSLPKIAEKNGMASSSGLYCNRCHTALEAIKMGNPLGCSDCYTVFGEVLVGELVAQNRLPSRWKKNLSVRKTQPLQIGKSPGLAAAAPTANKLTALNEALNEALKRENYEEAAWLRDQIKQIREGDDGRKS